MARFTNENYEKVFPRKNETDFTETVETSVDNFNPTEDIIEEVKENDEEVLN